MLDHREEMTLSKWPTDCAVGVVPVINAEVFISGHGGPCIQAHLNHLSPDIANSGWRDYGNRQGTHRLLNMFTELEIPTSIALNSYMVDHEPELFQTIVKSCQDTGYMDIIGHGLTNSLSAVKDISFEEQIRKSVDQIEKATGLNEKITSWLTPGFAAPSNGNDFLVDHGIRMSLDATNDDVMYKLKSSEDSTKELIILPYSMETNDISLCICQGYTGEEYGQTLIDYVQQLATEKNSKQKVVCFGLHTFIVGTPAKALHLKSALEKIKKMANVRFFNCQQLLNMI